MNGCIWYNVNVIVSVINGKGINCKTYITGKELSFFRSGGIVDIVALPKNIEELIFLLALASEYSIPYCVLGNGSNTLIKDDGFRGMIIHLKNLSDVILQGNSVIAYAGTQLPRLALLCAKKGLKGLGPLSGIPCTIGGATVKNAGCFGFEFSKLVNKVYCVTKSSTKPVVLDKSQLSYSYHSSNGTFKDLIVTHTLLDLEPTNEDLIEEIKEYAKKRNALHPSQPSLGSTFLKTETGIGAGYYIDKAGLKGTTIGGAQISTKHANFIINVGGARSSDYLALAELSASVIKKQFNLTLQKEIDIIGES